MYKPRENAGNLSDIQAERFNKAVRSGDDDTVRRLENIAALRARQDGYARANIAAGRIDPSTWTGGGSMFSYSREQARKYGGSLLTAIRGDKVEKGKGFFSSYEPKRDVELKDSNKKKVNRKRLNTKKVQKKYQEDAEKGIYRGGRNKGGLVNRPKK